MRDVAGADHPEQILGNLLLTGMRMSSPASTTKAPAGEPPVSTRGARNE